MNKQEIYLNEFNIPTKSSTYLPYSSGLLRAYAETNKDIKDNYKFKEFLFVRDDIKNLLKKYNNPSIAAFSCSVWNFQLSLAIAKAVKEKFPKCIIIFGGPQVPLNGDVFFKKYPFIDLNIYGEGERLFSEILLQNLEDKTKLPFKTSLRKEKTAEDLDIFPSPYVNGLFDEVMDIHKHMEFKAVIETNRACPFSCTFCFWGQSSVSKKLAYHSIDYINKEANWIANHGIKYVFCADANFGMFKRDIEIATLYSKIKEENNYPEKFRVCYGKNSTESIFQTAAILSKSDLAKTVTLAIQSNDAETLKNIKRGNIKMSTYIALQKRYTEAGIPTYTEIILGLPGETKDSFINGVDTIISSIINNQVFIYHCQILPNTEMAEPDYLIKYGIKTVRVPMAEVHGNVRLSGQIPEYEEIVIGTDSLPTEEWMECAVISWIVQLCHGLKVCFDIVEWLVVRYNITRMSIYSNFAHSDNEYIKRFWEIAEDITNSKIRCQESPEFGEIYWEPEEFTFVKIAYNRDSFYNDFLKSVVKFLQNNNLEYDPELEMVFEIQKNALPDTNNFKNPEEFATQVILYGRKSNKTTAKDIINRQQSPLVLPFN